jgi:hypothetical protein
MNYDTINFLCTLEKVRIFSNNMKKNTGGKLLFFPNEALLIGVS